MEKFEAGYYVTENPNIEDFTATGLSDVDGDAVWATFVVTSILSPQMTTAPDIY